MFVNRVFFENIELILNGRNIMRIKKRLNKIVGILFVAVFLVGVGRTYRFFYWVEI